MSFTKKQPLNWQRIAPAVCAIVMIGIVLAFIGGGEKKSEENVPTPIVYENQDRNGLCWQDTNCLSGLTCEGATNDNPGRCTFVCKTHSDCGNGHLCRAGSCQRDCAEAGEKCSDRRECCYFDANKDKQNDAFCDANAEGEGRCVTE